MTRLHRAAEDGYAAAAETYVRARPGYPAPAVDWLLAETGAGAVVEIGAGTGKLTSELVARDVKVVPVEPVAEMRVRLPVAGVDAVAEALPFEDASVGRIIASQSLHWADVDRALDEFDRVLAPSGSIGLIWNFRDVDSPWQRDLDALLADLRGDAPHSRDGRWQAAVGRSSFTVVAEQTWRWELDTDVTGVVDRVRSVSYVAALPADARARVDDRVRGLLERHGLAGRFAFPYVTEGYVLRRSASTPRPA